MEQNKTNEKSPASPSPSSAPMTTDSVVARSDFLGFDDWNFTDCDSSSTQSRDICNCRKTTSDERLVFLGNYGDFCNVYEKYFIFCIDLCDNPVIISQNANITASIGEWNAQTMSYSTISGSVFSDMAQLFFHPRALVGKTFTIVDTSRSQITTLKIRDIESCNILNTALRLVACEKLWTQFLT